MKYKEQKAAGIAAVYPGSFDPVTNGHLDIIKRAASLFDSLTIAVIRNPSKKPFFTAAERTGFVKRAIAGEGIEKINPNVKVSSFGGLLVDYMRKTGAAVVIRGLRAVSDFEYEFQMALMNRKLLKQVDTVFMMPDERYSYLSSKLVREVASFGGDVSAFVPGFVVQRLKAKCGGKSHV